MSTATRVDCVAVAKELAPLFAERAARHDTDDSFVSENYRDLKARGLFGAGVPAELGGGGATHAELCEMLRVFGQACGSTALAFSMHTHQVAIPAWRWRQEGAPVEPFLRRVAAEQLVLVSSGGSDWLAGSGTAEKVEGGWRVNARKVFSSGCPSGQVLMTMAVHADPEKGPTVLHFPVPLDAPGVRILENWRTLGMRGTGSHDVVLENVFVPDAAIGVRRPQGKWHPLYHVIALIALPLIYAVYVGVAEAARDRALALARPRAQDPDVPMLVGEMETELASARIALRALVDFAACSKAGPEATNEIVIARTLAGRSAMRTVEKAMEVAGGGGFFRSAGLERLFRDVQGARYHPLQEKRQARYTGRLVLGLDIDG
jgi:acyl-CoA dehydrogenase